MNPFDQGIEDYKLGKELTNESFYSLKTFEEREHWHGFQYAKGSERYLLEALEAQEILSNPSPTESVEIEEKENL